MITETLAENYYSENDIYGEFTVHGFMQDYIQGMLHNMTCIAKFSNDNDLRLLMVTIIKMQNF